MKRKIILILTGWILFACPIRGVAGASYEMLSKVASDINRTLPRMVNNDTKLMTVDVAPNELRYKYVFVNYSSRDISAQSLQQLWGNDVRNGVCSTPSTRYLLKMGVKAAYSYYGSDNIYITEISVREADCY